MERAIHHTQLLTEILNGRPCVEALVSGIPAAGSVNGGGMTGQLYPPMPETDMNRPPLTVNKSDTAPGSTNQQLPPDLGVSGTVRFFETTAGVLVYAEIRGLPDMRGDCRGNIFGFHIHEGKECSGTTSDPFADTGSHYNPHNCLHPWHAGDMPPLFGANGLALSVFLTDRFNCREIIGKTVVIHAMPDDLTTQPSGGSGAKIACGVIKEI